MGKGARICPSCCAPVPRGMELRSKKCASWPTAVTLPQTGKCRPQTVRERFHRFNEEGLDGLGDRPGAGRKRRISETERSLIISLVGTDPPGRLVRGAGGELEAIDEEREAHYWTLDALTTAARERVGSSLGEAKSDVSSKPKVFDGETLGRGPKVRTPSSSPQKDESSRALHQPSTELECHLLGDELGPVSPRTFPPAPGCSPDAHRISRRRWSI
jgi:hypothetical protein